MKKFFKSIICIILCGAIIIIGVVVHNSLFGYTFENDIECINTVAKSCDQIDKIIYKYENDKTELLTYSTKDGEYFTCYLDKKTIGNKSYYRSRLQTNIIAPITYYKEWNKVNNNLYFIYVEYKDDINEIDCQGCSPIGTEITYTNTVNDTKTMWIYIIDKTLD